jgi:hypothetical protein
MTLKLAQPLSYRHSLDTVLTEIMSTEISDPNQMTRIGSTQSNSIRHSLPTEGLRYRSDAYRSATVAQTVTQTVAQSVQRIAPSCQLPAAKSRAVDYSTAHRLHIQQRLQHRIAVAIAKGDQRLVNLLHHELQHELRQAG